MSAQNMDSSSQQGFPTLCSNGCGFFSSVDKKGLCSVCFKETQKKESPQATSSEDKSTTTSLSDLHQQTTLSETTINVDEPIESKCEASSSAITPPSTSGNPEDDKDEPIPAKKPKKSRCLNCKKKLGLTGFTCRCGGLYCSIHRYSDKHECNFDYKAMGEKEISENNPVIVAQKVAKI